MGFWPVFLRDQQPLICSPCVRQGLRRDYGKGEQPGKGEKTRPQGSPRDIYRWYHNLEEVDLKGRQSTSLDEIKSWIVELNKIEREVMRVSVPLSYAGELYSLRIHITHVQESLRKIDAVLRGEGNTSTGTPMSWETTNFYLYKGG
jgi:hypothetical protein